VPSPYLLRAFAFHVVLFKSAVAESGQPPGPPPEPPPPPDGRLGDGAFQEVSGLEVEMDVQEYLEGGRNDGVIRRVGRAKYQNLVLKRGMLYTDEQTVVPELWVWLQSVVAGVRPVDRYNGVIEVRSGESDERIVAKWTFDRGLPAKVTGPQLNAKTGEIVIEELHIAHEGLRLEAVA
jgi:phage tail-like protein